MSDIDRISPTHRPNDRVVMRQEWRKLLFLHWAVPPADVQTLLPPGLTVDTFAGQAYVGLVPFTMRNVRPVGFPAVPGLSHFHECNVRTYVHRNGQPGVWFWSLDAAQPIAVEIARRVWRLPYFNAQMSLTEQDGEILYHTRRTHHDAPSGECRVRYAPTGTPAPALPGTLTHFLVERYLLYAQGKNGLLRGQVHHTSYPIQSATVSELADTLVAATGLPVPGGVTRDNDMLTHYASGVSVEVFPMKQC